MARGATVVNMDITLSDVDRGVYESLSLKLAQHPSESAEYLVARVLAYCLEYGELLQFSAGLGEPDLPAVIERDLTGQLLSWIEVGCPLGPRLHKASKAADRVVVYCHKDPAPWLGLINAKKLHRAQDIALIQLDRDGIQALAQRLERRNDWSVSRIEGVLYIEVSGESLSLELQPLAWR